MKMSKRMITTISIAVVVIGALTVNDYVKTTDRNAKVAVLEKQASVGASTGDFDSASEDIADALSLDENNEQLNTLNDKYTAAEIKQQAKISAANAVTQAAADASQHASAVAYAQSLVDAEKTQGVEIGMTKNYVEILIGEIPTV